MKNTEKILSLVSAFILISFYSLAQPPDTIGINAQIIDSVSATSPIEIDSLGVNTTSIDTSSTVDSTSTPSSPSAVSSPPATEQFEVDLSFRNDPIYIDFEEIKKEQSPDSIYINFAKVVNNSGEAIQGKLKIHPPSEWSLIGQSEYDIDLEAGGTENIPLILGISPKSEGGIAYVVNMTLSTKQELISNSCYVRVPMKSSWRVYPESRQFHFSQYKNSIEYKLRFENRGNNKEIVRLDFNWGELLTIDEVSKESKVQYVELAPGADSLISYTIHMADVSKEERLVKERNYKNTSLGIKFTTTNDTVYENARFSNLKSEYQNPFFYGQSPLNIDVQFYNLVSQSRPKLRLGASGNILFKEDRRLDYQLFANNLLPNQGNQFGNNLYNTTRFWAGYRTPKYFVQAGDIGIGHYIPIYGIGVSGEYFINEHSSVEAIAVRNRFNPIIGFGAIYNNGNLPIKRLRASIGGGYQFNSNSSDRSFYTLLEGRYTFLDHHQVKISLLPTYTSIGDTVNYFGIGRNVFYGYNDQKLRIYASNYAILRNLSPYTAETYQLGGNYKFNKRQRVLWNGNFSRNFLNKFGELSNFLDRGNYNLNAQILYSHQFKNTLQASIGPQSNLSSVLTYAPNDVSIRKNIITKYNGLYTNIFYQIGHDHSVGGNYSIGYSSVGENPSLFSYAGDTLFALTQSYGASYRYKGFTLYGSYQIGSKSYVDFLSFNNNDDSPYTTLSQVVQIRPRYERYFFNKKVRLAGYINYMTYSNSSLEIISSNIRLDLFLRKGWTAYGINNSYLNRQNDSESGLISNKTATFSFGFRKSFDIKQPAIKYHDVNVICFHDVNGNLERDNGEMLLGNIIVKVEKVKDSSIIDSKHSSLPTQTLITDPDGIVRLGRVPEGKYQFKFHPLEANFKLQNILGDEQEIFLVNDSEIYIPYAESYKIQGKIVLKRDEFSSNGNISVSGIRITASVDSVAYSCLSDENGNYVLDVPQAGVYKVEINNIFGDEFIPDKNNLKVHFNGFKVYNVDFEFSEKERGLNLEGGDLLNQLQNGSLNLNSTDSSTSQNGIADTNSPEDENYVFTKSDQVISSDYEFNEGQLPDPVVKELIRYRVQIGLYKEELRQDELNRLLSVGSVEAVSTVIGETRYTVGFYKNYREAAKKKRDLRAKGFDGTFVIADYEGLTITAKKAIELQE